RKQAKEFADRLSAGTIQVRQHSRDATQPASKNGVAWLDPREMPKRGPVSCSQNGRECHVFTESGHILLSKKVNPFVGYNQACPVAQVQPAVQLFIFPVNPLHPKENPKRQMTLRV